MLSTPLLTSSLSRPRALFLICLLCLTVRCVGSRNSTGFLRFLFHPSKSRFDCPKSLALDSFDVMSVTFKFTALVAAPMPREVIPPADIFFTGFFSVCHQH